jgi:dTDP-4-amino-4,6-dideoxygalactose transaminase
MEHVQKVPFLDLKSQIDPIRNEILAAISQAIDNSDYVMGPSLDAFESAFADYCDCHHAMGVSSGTDALFLILRALGVGPGDEVITVPNTFIATVEAIAHTGAKPILVDVDDDSYCIDPEAVEDAITPRTRVIIPVHLFGLPCDMDPLMQLAEKHALYVVEDACQSHGATYKGKKTGSLGHAAAFSFYPSKNLGALGDGGAVTTDDPEIARKVKALRHHAQYDRNVHPEVGYNCRLDSIQAAVLNVKLPKLDGWNTRRRQIASFYETGLAREEYRFQKGVLESAHVYHIFALRHPRRKLVHDQLDRAMIGRGRHIAPPIHLQPGYEDLGYRKGAFPVSEKLCEELISLPVFPGLSESQLNYVVEVLNRVVIPVS